MMHLTVCGMVFNLSVSMMDTFKHWVMISKHIQHLAIVSLKYFFDIDYTHCRDAFTMFFLVAGFIRHAARRLGAEFRASLIMVDEDAAMINAELLALWQQLKNHIAYISPVIMAQLKANIFQNELLRWREK